jgi:hypothetical protein
MQQSRRDFFKAATVGAVGVTIFGFDLKPARHSFAQTPDSRMRECTTRSESAERT